MTACLRGGFRCDRPGKKSGILGKFEEKNKNNQPLLSGRIDQNEEIDPIFVKWPDKRSAKSRQFVNDEIDLLYLFCSLFLSAFLLPPISNYRLYRLRISQKKLVAAFRFYCPIELYFHFHFLFFLLEVRFSSYRDFFPSDNYR